MTLRKVALASRTAAAASRRIALALALVALVPNARACGPWFGTELLSDRAVTLGNLPEGTFAFEARRLAEPSAKWTVVEHADWLYPESKVSRPDVERGWWGDDFDRIDALRSAPSAAAVYATGKGLPEETRRYMAGAAGWATDLGEAAKRFRSVLDLPAGERTHYGVWAQYMLGRIAAVNEDAKAAQAAFAATRALVAAGFDDPLGLAATSLGDEAKVRLDAGDDAGAVALYAEQAAAGSEFGRTSLLAVARALMKDDARLDRGLREPIVQRLVTIYLFTRSAELSESEVDWREAGNSQPPPDAAAKIAHVLEAIERAGLDNVDGADRVAALAYRGGRWDLAKRYAEKDTSGLAWWVRAKLALRAGDVPAATRAYAQAAKAFPANETWGTQQQEDSLYYETTTPQCRVAGEQGIVALGRGEYVAAMRYLYNAASVYWGDAAYVAERVLTLDELEDFVHNNVPPAPPKANEAAQPDDGSTQVADDASGSAEAQDADAQGGRVIPPATLLRTLLARRLMRAQRWDDALAYFDDPALRRKAQAYAALRRAALSGGRIEQAEAVFKAASATREDGMDLLAFELAPDYNLMGGSFEWGYSGEPQKGDAALPIANMAADEATRVAASAAAPPQRFHYRYVAANLANRSADLLPARSQAFAAVLCHAAGYVLARDPGAAQPFYRRYLDHGAYVPWGASFGRDCPEPDFPGAAKRLHVERVAYARHLVRRALPYGGAASIGLGLAMLGVWRTRRRHAGASESDAV